MIHLVLGFTLLTSFLGFNNKSTILDVSNRFGTPFSVQQTNKNNIQQFTYKRESYICNIFCGKKGQVLDVQAYGLNSHVIFNGIKLGDEFKDVILKMGKPESYSFKDKYVTVNYEDSHFTFSKIQKGYQVVKIDVDFTKQNASEAIW